MRISDSELEHFENDIHFCQDIWYTITLSGRISKHLKDIFLHCPKPATKKLDF